jgi:hypothetical protein
MASPMTGNTRRGRLQFLRSKRLLVALPGLGFLVLAAPLFNPVSHVEGEGGFSADLTTRGSAAWVAAPASETRPAPPSSGARVSRDRARDNRVLFFSENHQRIDSTGT